MSKLLLLATVLLGHLTIDAFAQTLPRFQVGHRFDDDSGNVDRILIFDVGRGNKIRGSILERAFPEQKGNSIYLTKERFFGHIRGYQQNESRFRATFTTHAPRVGRIKGTIDYYYALSRSNAGTIDVRLPASKMLYLKNRRTIRLRSKY